MRVGNKEISQEMVHINKSKLNTSVDTDFGEILTLHDEEELFSSPADTACIGCTVIADNLINNEIKIIAKEATEKVAT